MSRRPWARWTYTERYGWCIEVGRPRPLWRSALDWTLTILFACALVGAQLLFR